MLQVSWFEFIVRGFPEALLFVFAVYTFTKTKVNLKKYSLSVILFWIIVYLIRFLPIQYGIHTLLSLIVLIIITNSLNKIDVIKSIQAGIITFILGFVSEGLNAFFIQSVLEKDLSIISKDPILKTLYGLPSLILFGIFTILYFVNLKKRKELKNV